MAAQDREDALRKAGIKVIQGKRLTATVQIDLTDLHPDYIGTFKYHRPSLMEQMSIGVIKSQMLAGMNVDILTDNIAHMTATLRVVMDTAPEWFNLEEIEDYKALETVYDKYMEFFRIISGRNQQADDKGDSEASS